MIDQAEANLLRNKSPFWDKLTQAQMDLLISTARVAHFSKGQSIHFGENDCIGVLIVKQGMIRTYITSEEGREITLYRLDKEDICILSASCILETIDFDVSVNAEIDSDILIIGAQIFSKLSSENVYVELFSYKLATERFSDVMWVMQQMLFTSFDRRLAGFLLEEVQKQGTLEIRLTHEQIAKYLGSAREVVSRMLKYFSTEGYVTLSRGGIRVNDKNALRLMI